MENDEFNVKGLDALIKALKVPPPVIKVGIFGDARNATIGAAHEYGTTKLPQRSFLRVPLATKLNSYLEKSNAFDKDALAQTIKQGSLLTWSQKIGAVAINVVLDAFNTGGFGKWPGWKSPHYENNTGQLLLDTQQLRSSITSEVSE